MGLVGELSIVQEKQGEDINQLQRDFQRHNEHILSLAAAFESYRAVQTATSLYAIGHNLLPFFGPAAMSVLQAFTSVCEEAGVYDGKDAVNGVAEFVGGKFERDVKSKNYTRPMDNVMVQASRQLAS